MVVTIAAADYGSAGGVTETLPAGFAYVSSSLAASQVTELSGKPGQVHPPGGRLLHLHRYGLQHTGSL